MTPSCSRLAGTKTWKLIHRVAQVRARTSLGENRLGLTSISSSPDVRAGKHYGGYQLARNSRTVSSISSTNATRNVQDQILTALENKELELSSSAEWSVNPYELERHGHGESYHPTKTPDIVLSPSCVDDVSKILKYCNDHSIPVVPFGAGTSVEGHVCCLYGGVSLDMSKLQSIKIPGEGEDEYDNDIEYDNAEHTEDHLTLDDPIAIVGGGVTRKSLNEALRHTGLQFVVDPGANATIGGMVATGASGTTAVRYGTMKDNVMELECVLADGTVIRTGTRSLKNSAGYDLTSLMVGSEGTLGVVTSVTVKLHPVADHVMAATVVFDDLYNAADCVAMIKLSDIPVVRCELLDASSVKAFNNWEMNNKQSDREGNKRMALEEKPTLFLEFQAPSIISLEDQVEQTEAIAKDFGGYNFIHKSDENERRGLWAARHDLYYAAINSRPGNTSGASNTVVTDACVPLSKFAAVVEATARDVEKMGVYGLLFGHCGDGNFHVILPLMPTDGDEYIARVHKINDNLIKRTLKVGGSCTGEHGIGYGKIQYLTEQYGTGTVAAMKLVKNAFDPKGIMNPGKIVG